MYQVQAVVHLSASGPRECLTDSEELLILHKGQSLCIKYKKVASYHLLVDPA
jgi:hypothetical protein